MSQTPAAVRIEHDLLGDLAVPADAYYGVQTARALENFHISGVQLQPLSRSDQGIRDGQDGGGARQPRVRTVRPSDILTGIEGACQELIDGKLHDQFRLDVFQGGAGTSTNMNANEVIANRALELMGHAKGEYQLLRPARPRQRIAVHQRRLPDVAARGDRARQRPPDCRDDRTGGGVPRQGPRVRRRAEDGAHAAAGRRADDARPGVHGVWRDARWRGPHAPEDRAGALRDEHGRHGDRHRPERAGRLCRGLHEGARRDHRAADLPGREPDRGDAGHAGVRPVLVLHEEPGDQALEGLQRPAAAVVRPALRPARDQPAGQAARLVDHAGQGQPGHPRSGQHGLLPGHRQRPHDLDGGRGAASCS